MKKIPNFSLSKIELFRIASKSLSILDEDIKQKLILATLSLSLLSVMDVVAIGLVGLLSLLTLDGISAEISSNKLLTVLRLLRMEELSFQIQTLILATVIAFLLIVRTFLSAEINRRMLYFLSHKSVNMSEQLTKNIFFRDSSTVKSLPRSNISYSLTEGIDKIAIGVIGSLINIGSDFVLILVLVLMLNIVNIVLGLTSVLFFAVVGIAIYLRQGNISARLGKVLTQKRVEIQDKLFGIIDTLPEVQLRGTLSSNLKLIADLRRSQSLAWAQLSSQPLMAKYYLEICMVVGGMAIGGAQFLFYDAKRAIAYLSLFLAAGIRVIPAILRLQSSLVNIRSSAGVASLAFQLLDLPKSNQIAWQVKQPSSIYKSHNALEFQNVDFFYPDNKSFALKNLNFEINRNQFTAIVGPSGSGKSTLFDLALGFCSPSSGSVTIQGLLPDEFIAQNAGVVSVVTQQTKIVKGTMRENLLLGYKSKLNDSEILQLLRSLELTDLLHSLPYGLDSELGEFGSRLSGGQKQRIGIARAMCTSPQYLFLDEATSSLDAATEDSVMQFLNNTKSKITLIVIAHRLSTVKSADQIIYLDDGQVIASGTFLEVRKSVPNFEIQAKLLGI